MPDLGLRRKCRFGFSHSFDFIYCALANSGNNSVPLSRFYRTDNQLIIESYDTEGRVRTNRGTAASAQTYRLPTKTTA